MLFYETIVLSLRCFTVFFSMEFLTGYLRLFPLETGGGGQIGKSTYAMGGRGFVAKLHLRTMVDRGKISTILVRTY